MRGVKRLKENMEERAERLALYIIENRTTVRAAAQKFGISKSTVHKDISERLPQFNRGLYLQVKAVLDVNKAQRHIRGGIATRKKYRGTGKGIGYLFQIKLRLLRICLQCSQLRHRQSHKLLHRHLFLQHLLFLIQILLNLIMHL